MEKVTVFLLYSNKDLNDPSNRTWIESIEKGFHSVKSEIIITSPSHDINAGDEYIKKLTELLDYNRTELVILFLSVNYMNDSIISESDDIQNLLTLFSRKNRLIPLYLSSCLYEHLKVLKKKNGSIQGIPYINGRVRFLTDTSDYNSDIIITDYILRPLLNITKSIKAEKSVADKLNDWFYELSKIVSNTISQATEIDKLQNELENISGKIAKLIEELEITNKEEDSNIKTNLPSIQDKDLILNIPTIE